MSRELASFGAPLGPRASIGRGVLEVSRIADPDEIARPYFHAPVLHSQRERNRPNECTFSCMMLSGSSINYESFRH